MKLLPILILLFINIGQLNANSLIPPYTAGTCISCHDKNGVGVAPNFPNLGGQHAEYLFKQMQDMQSGKTRSPSVMVGLFDKLTKQNLHYLAQYYSTLPISIGLTPQKALKNGETVETSGQLTLQDGTKVDIDNSAGI